MTIKLINMEKKSCLNFDRKIRQIEQCAVQWSNSQAQEIWPISAAD